MTDIKIIALDLDGTLLDSDKRLSPANRAALEAAAEAGIEIVPSTGRMYHAMPEAVRSLPFIHYAITINGALVLDVASGEEMYSCNISNADAIALCRFLKPFPILFDCYWNSRGFAQEKPFEHAEDYIADIHSLKMMKDLRRPVPDLEEFLADGAKCPQKMQVFTRDQALRDELRDSIAERFPQFAVTTSLPENIEINNAECDKGRSLLGLAEKLGYEPQQTMAFGDGLNDISMLKAAGIGVAMGNAHPDVKKIAARVTADCDHDGVAIVIDELLRNSL